MRKSSSVLLKKRVLSLDSLLLYEVKENWGGLSYPLIIFYMSRASDSEVVHKFHTELAAHVLPDGWDSDLDRFTFMYKNKAKPGKQFMLTVIEPKFLMPIRFF